MSGTRAVSYTHLNALLKKAMGYKYTEVRTVDKGDKVEVTTTEKEVPPDLSAISFVLRNYCPEKWSDKPMSCLLYTSSFAGEILSNIIPFNMPAGVYGILIMFAALASGVLPLDRVEKTADFMLLIMPLLFVPAGVRLITVWDSLKKDVYKRQVSAAA